MPRLTNGTPSYRQHKASGQAIVTLNGEDVYLEPFGSKTSRRQYDQVVAEWLARGRQRPGIDAKGVVQEFFKPGCGSSTGWRRRASYSASFLASASARSLMLSAKAGTFDWAGVSMNAGSRLF